MDAFLKLIGWRSASPAPPPTPPAPTLAPPRRTQSDIALALCNEILSASSPTAEKLDQLAKNWNALKTKISPGLSDKVYKVACKTAEIYQSIEPATKTMLEEVFAKQLNKIERAAIPSATNLQNIANDLDTLWKALQKTSVGGIDSPLSHQVEGIAYKIRELYASKKITPATEINNKLIKLQRANFESVISSLTNRAARTISEEEHTLFTKVLQDFWRALGRDVTREKLAANILYAAETLNHAKKSRELERIITPIKAKLPKDKRIGKKELSLATPVAAPRSERSSSPTPLAGAGAAGPPRGALRPSPLRPPPSPLGATTLSSPSTATSPLAPKIRHTADELATYASQETDAPRATDRNLSLHLTSISELFQNPEAYFIAAEAGISFDRLCRNFMEAFFKLSQRDQNAFFRANNVPLTFILNYALRSVIEDSYNAKLEGSLVPATSGYTAFLKGIRHPFKDLLDRLSTRTTVDDGTLTSLKDQALGEIEQLQLPIFNPMDRALEIYLSELPLIDPNKLENIRERQKLLRRLLINVKSSPLREELQRNLDLLNQNETKFIVAKVPITGPIITGISQYDLECTDLRGARSKGAARHACALIAAANIKAQLDGTDLSPTDAILTGLYRYQTVVKGAYTTTDGRPIHFDDAKRLVNETLTPIECAFNNIPFEEDSLQAYKQLLATIKAATSEHQKVGAVIRLGDKFLSITMQRKADGGARITLTDSHGFEKGSGAGNLEKKFFQCDFDSITKAADFLSVYHRPKPPLNEQNCIEFHLFTTKPPPEISPAGPGAAGRPTSRFPLAVEAVAAAAGGSLLNPASEAEFIRANKALMMS